MSCPEANAIVEKHKKVWISDSKFDKKYIITKRDVMRDIQQWNDTLDQIEAEIETLVRKTVTPKQKWPQNAFCYCPRCGAKLIWEEEK